MPSPRAPSNLSRLLAHLAWADVRVHEALAAAAPSPPVEAVRLYAHILGAELVWLSRLTIEPPLAPVWPELSLTECGRLGRESHALLTAYVASLSPADLDRAIHYVNSAGQPFQSTVEDILLHVCLHGTYHRGQVAQLLRLNGQLPASTDYIAFTRGAPAASSRPGPADGRG